jgi:precorrin-8X/cobalt-precorrin-8 methylmutase
MARAGVSARRLEPFGAVVDCLIAAPETAARAQIKGLTRSAAAVDLAVDRMSRGIYVVGNAPTALFRLIERVRGGDAAPALIVGLPVGFVNAAESKAALLELDTPYITNVGRKGGSNVAASAINALADLAVQP